jgi:phosphoglycolate phosphatase
MFEKYKHIIWDWNGTLFDDVNFSVELINGLLAKYGLETISREHYSEIFQFPVKNYYAAAGFDFEKVSFEKVGKEWIAGYEKRKLEYGIYPGSAELLERISRLGIGQSILSAYSQHTLEEIVEHCGLTKYFAHLYGLNTIYAPSKVDLGKKLMNELGHKKGETLLIGDTEHDYDVATEIGADCILIANGHQSKSKLTKIGVPVYDELNKILQEF